jgi:hypothetical protein
MGVTSILEVLFGSRLGERLYRVRTVDPENAGAALLWNICNYLPINTVYHLQLSAYLPVPLYWLCRHLFLINWRKSPKSSWIASLWKSEFNSSHVSPSKDNFIDIFNWCREVLFYFLILLKFFRRHYISVYWHTINNSLSIAHQQMH